MFYEEEPLSIGELLILVESTKIRSSFLIGKLKRQQIVRNS